jgi:hypothetical protein
MSKRPHSSLMLILGLAALWCLTALPAISQTAQDSGFFPPENFTPMNATLPNNQLNFGDDTQESCCAKDYAADGQPVKTRQSASASGQNVVPLVVKTDFERSNPRYLENTTPAFLVTCERFADLPEQASNMSGAAETDASTLPITSYSTNVSLRAGAAYASDPGKHYTSDFHVEAAGGGSRVSLQDVHGYSVCMARGNNTAWIANTENGSVMTYNGNDHILLAGNNTNMLTRTGAGNDTIEVYQARPHSAITTPSGTRDESWTAYNIYKTALSGGSGTDTLVIKGTPFGTKWCHIGGYRIYGEAFYVVEFALPPTVTEGPRRQRINIGQSVEYVVIKGKRYTLNDFLVHGSPADTVARAIPIGNPLPHVRIGSR